MAPWRRDQDRAQGPGAGLPPSSARKPEIDMKDIESPAARPKPVNFGRGRRGRARGGRSVAGAVSSRGRPLPFRGTDARRGSSPFGLRSRHRRLARVAGARHAPHPTGSPRPVGRCARAGRFARAEDGDRQRFPWPWKGPRSRLPCVSRRGVRPLPASSRRRPFCWPEELLPP